MPFTAKAYKVLIASPSDVQEERSVAFNTIIEWSNLHAQEIGAILLPVRWETHSAPEYGRRPQEILNQQIVADSDILVGIFWTRLGTETGVSDSGTVEEIEQFAQSGKMTMLYFSNARTDPDSINTEQLNKLREFKKKALPNGLIENYSNLIEFRDKLSRHIDFHIRKMHLAANDEHGAIIQGARIELTISIPVEESEPSKDIHIQPRLIQFSGDNNIPDYEEDEPEGGSAKRGALAALMGSSALLGSTHQVNSNYFREYRNYVILSLLFNKITFHLENIGTYGATDVYAEIKFRATKGRFAIMSDTEFPTQEPKKRYQGWEKQQAYPALESLEFLTEWKSTISIRAIQPKRKIDKASDFQLGATDFCEIEIETTIYAESFAEPQKQKSTIKISPVSEEYPISEILEEHK